MRPQLVPNPGRCTRCYSEFAGHLQAYNANCRSGGISGICRYAQFQKCPSIHRNKFEQPMTSPESARDLTFAWLLSLDTHLNPLGGGGQEAIENHLVCCSLQPGKCRWLNSRPYGLSFPGFKSDPIASVLARLPSPVARVVPDQSGFLVWSYKTSGGPSGYPSRSSKALSATVGLASLMVRSGSRLTCWVCHGGK